MIKGKKLSYGRELFTESLRESLPEAVKDASYLLTRGYQRASSIAFVGDHFLYGEAQRALLQMIAANLNEVTRFRTTEVYDAALENRVLLIDGFSILRTIEAGVAGGPLIRCADGIIRDASGITTDWDINNSSASAIAAILSAVEDMHVSECRCLILASTPHSGMLRQQWSVAASARRTPWNVMLTKDPAWSLLNSEGICGTTDPKILSACAAWTHLSQACLSHVDTQPEIIDFSA